MPERLAYWLEELRTEHNDIVGKKCANLGEMARIGLSIPRGFALSVHAYSVFMDETGAADQVSEVLSATNVTHTDMEGIQELSATLRQIMESKPMPPELEEVILSFYEKLCGRCEYTDVAVSTRSAGAASHPGQYETYLNVKGKADVLEKIKKVWGSTYNARSITNRLRKNLTAISVPIGVAVLEMVNARSAGIAFSVDPNTGDETRMIVEANWGLGESVVSGELIPDRWVLDKETCEVRDRQLGKKETVVSLAADGVIEQETPVEKGNAFCCTDTELSEIGRLAKELENHFNEPQDIEWAITEDRGFSSVILLQARPAVVVKKSASDAVVDMMVGMFRK
jgi:pyruvate,water dikinase